MVKPLIPAQLEGAFNYVRFMFYPYCLGRGWDWVKLNFYAHHLGIES